MVKGESEESRRAAQWRDSAAKLTSAPRRCSLSFGYLCDVFLVRFVRFFPLKSDTTL